MNGNEGNGSERSSDSSLSRKQSLKGPHTLLREHLQTGDLTEDVSEHYMRLLQEAGQSLSNRDVIIAMLQQQLKKMEDLYKKNIDETQEIRYKYCTTAQELNNLKKVLEKIEEDNKRLKSKTEVISRSTNDKGRERDVESYKREIKQWKDLYQQVLKKMDSLESGTSEIQTMLKESRSSLNSAQEDIVSENISKVKDTLHQQSKKLDTIIIKLEEDLNCAHERNACLEEQLTIIKVDFNRDSIFPGCCDQESLTNGDDELQKELEELKNQIASKNESIKNLNNSLKYQKEEMARLKSFNDELREDLDNQKSLKREESAGFEEEVAAKENTIAQLMAENENLKEKIDAQTATRILSSENGITTDIVMSDLDLIQARLEAEIEEKSETIRTLEKSLESLREESGNTIEHLQKEKKSLETENNKSMEEVANLSQMLKNKEITDEELENMTDLYNALQMEKEVLKQENDRSSAEISGLNEKMELQEKTIEDLQKLKQLYDELQHTSAEKYKYFIGEIERLNCENCCLFENLNQIQATREQSKDAFVSTEDVPNTDEEEINKLKEKISELQKQNEELLKMKDFYESNISDLKKTAKEMESQYNDLLQKNQRALQEISRECSEVVSELKVKNTTGDSKHMRKEIGILEQVIIEKDEEVRHLKCQLDEATRALTIALDHAKPSHGCRNADECAKSRVTIRELRQKVQELEGQNKNLAESNRIEQFCRCARDKDMECLQRKVSEQTKELWNCRPGSAEGDLAQLIENLRQENRGLKLSLQNAISSIENKLNVLVKENKAPRGDSMADFGQERARCSNYCDRTKIGSSVNDGGVIIKVPGAEADGRMPSVYPIFSAAGTKKEIEADQPGASEVQPLPQEPSNLRLQVQGRVNVLYKNKHGEPVITTKNIAQNYEITKTKDINKIGVDINVQTIRGQPASAENSQMGLDAIDNQLTREAVADRSAVTFDPKTSGSGSLTPAIKSSTRFGKSSLQQTKKDDRKIGGCRCTQNISTDIHNHLQSTKKIEQEIEALQEELIRQQVEMYKASMSLNLVDEGIEPEDLERINKLCEQVKSYSSEEESQEDKEPHVENKSDKAQEKKNEIKEKNIAICPRQCPTKIKDKTAEEEEDKNDGEEDDEEDDTDSSGDSPFNTLSTIDEYGEEEKRSNVSSGESTHNTDYFDKLRAETEDDGGSDVDD